MSFNIAITPLFPFKLLRPILTKYLLVGCFIILTLTTNAVKAAPSSTLTVTGNNAVGAGGNGITATSLTYGQTGVVLYGFTVTETGATCSMSAINFDTNIVLGDFFTNLRYTSVQIPIIQQVR